MAIGGAKGKGERRAPVPSSSHGPQSQLKARSQADSRQLLRKTLRPHPGSVGKNLMIDEQRLFRAREGGVTDGYHQSAVF